MKLEGQWELPYLGIVALNEVKNVECRWRLGPSGIEASAISLHYTVVAVMSRSFRASKSASG